jgi:hypothetical protein
MTKQERAAISFAVVRQSGLTPESIPRLVCGNGGRVTFEFANHPPHVLALV